jgi:hypothetical protein
MIFLKTWHDDIWNIVITWPYLFWNVGLWTSINVSEGIMERWSSLDLGSICYMKDSKVLMTSKSLKTFWNLQCSTLNFFHSCHVVFTSSFIVICIKFKKTSRKKIKNKNQLQHNSNIKQNQFELEDKMKLIWVYGKPWGSTSSVRLETKSLCNLLCLYIINITK